jgi:2-C-methyl-D-erythritol 4-phosphate cytidylyltransferase
MSKSVGVIIPAAGGGSRLGGIAKPLIKIGGMTLLERLLKLFSESNGIGEICVAVPQNQSAQFEKIAKGIESKCSIRIVEGGTERAHSVKRAFDQISSFLEDEDLVCVHDAARPLLSKFDLERVLEAAWSYNASFLAARVKDTLKVIDEKGFCVRTIDRSEVFAAQTPQVMKVKFLRKAYELVRDISGMTDEMMLLEKIGIRAFVVEPMHPNIKLTTHEDLELIEKILA